MKIRCIKRDVHINVIRKRTNKLFQVDSCLRILLDLNNTNNIKILKLILPNFRGNIAYKY